MNERMELQDTAAFPHYLL